MVQPNYILKLLINDLKNSLFGYTFVETTTSEINKQYDGYATYLSKRFRCIITSYLGSLFVGHCNHKKLVEHFFVFLDKVDFSPSWLLNIGMGGHSVNKTFLTEGVKEPKKKKISVIYISFWLKHTLNVAFKLLNVFKLITDLDEVAVDLYFFFKKFSASCEDYKNLEAITAVTSWYTKEHVDSQLLSIENLLVITLEQYIKLQEYFLVFLPKTKNFNY